MQTYHEWDAGRKHYRAVIDEEYQVERSCGGAEKCKHPEPDRVMDNGELCKELWDQETTVEQECDYWFEKEQRGLDSGETVALGVIVSEPCRGLVDEKGEKRVAIVESHCECCSGRKETDSLWGIVVENSHEAIERFVKEGM